MATNVVMEVERNRKRNLTETKKELNKEIKFKDGDFIQRCKKKLAQQNAATAPRFIPFVYSKRRAEDEVQCPGCGGWYKPKGITLHKRKCKIVRSYIEGNDSLIVNNQPGINRDAELSSGIEGNGMLGLSGEMNS